MRIKRDFNYESEQYTNQLQERAKEVFEYCSKMGEIKILIGEIRENSMELKNLFLTEQELNKKNELLCSFDSRVKAMIGFTFKNMEKYQLEGWKELIYDGDNDDE